MKSLENEAKTFKKRVIEVFLVIFVFLSCLLGFTLYIYYTVNSKYLEELSLTRDVHSLRAEMQAFTDKNVVLGYIQVKEVIKLVKESSLKEYI